MAKELEFLQVSEAVSKESFLQHIYELKLIPVAQGMTYNALFSTLEEKFKEDTEKYSAVKQWIEWNRENCTDPALLEKPILVEADGDSMYAVFDFIPLKES